jgi:4-amino-4-deoxy-L-arabinose transferase-like glycosyltransferase
MADASAAGPRVDWRLLRAVALVLLALKLVLLAVAHPFMDETYYFVWGQHLQLSYFDHPSLVGWTQALAGAVFGWNIAGLRAMVVVTLFGDLALLYLLARGSAGDDWRWSFWTGAVLFLATPILFGLSSVALPDHLLILCVLATVLAVERLRTSGDVRWLYGAALAIGCATLSKYTGALLGVAALFYVVTTPAMRPLLRSPHFYLAAVLAPALQAPVLLWNMQHGFASFGFIVGGRQALPTAFDLSGAGGFLLGAIVVLSPFVVVAIGRFLFARNDGHGFARIVFWLSTLGFLAASAFTNILIHWNVVAYAVVLPFLAPYFRSRLLASAQIVYGVLAIGVAAVNYAVVPVTALTSHADQTSGWSYGWDEIGAAVDSLRQNESVGFVAATDYALTSPLAFALHDASVTSLSPKRDAYDDWFDAGAHAGQDALIVADQWRPLGAAIKARFASVEKLRSLDIVRSGRTLDRYTIYLGKGFAAN